LFPELKGHWIEAGPYEAAAIRRIAELEEERERKDAEVYRLLTEWVKAGNAVRRNANDASAHDALMDAELALIQLARSLEVQGP
jgi:hypothetical protein